MKEVSSTEVMLAELVEQNTKEQKSLSAMQSSLESLSSELTKLNNILSPTLKPVKFEEVIPRKDADERAKYLVRLYGDMQAKYANLKAEYGELQAKTRYWASNQWAKHLFRWLFKTSLKLGRETDDYHLIRSECSRNSVGVYLIYGSRHWPSA